MAAPEGSAAMPIEISDDGSESGSSYIGSAESSPRRGECQWQTARHRYGECSRYLDCPSHTVERATSDAESDRSEAGGGGASMSEDTSGIPRGGEEPSAPPNAGRRDPLPASSAGHSTPAADAGRRTASRESREDGQSPRRTDTALGGTPSPTRPAPQTMSSSGQPPSIDLTGDSPEPAARSRASSRHLPAAPGPERELPMAPPPPPPPPHSPELRRLSGAGAGGPSRPERTGPQDIVLPRWQPDAEVTYCPICHTQFSIFVRKHHCRKCGRVVCNSCSPHRITIPYQYIVQPPGTPAVPAQSFSSSPAGRVGGHADFSSLGGGERVRLCNPCVPDPNTTPPQSQQSAGARTHHRSQSTVAGNMDRDGSAARHGAHLAPAPAGDAHSRSRSATMQAGGVASSSRAPGNTHVSPESRIMAGTPPTHSRFFNPFASTRLNPPAPLFVPPSSSSSPWSHLGYPPYSSPHPPSGAPMSGYHPYNHSHQPSSSSRSYGYPPYNHMPRPPELMPPPHRYPANTSLQSPSSSQPSGYPPYTPVQYAPPPLSSSAAQGYQLRSLPQPPQIDEEDECPVCHRELPPRTLANFEALRESHITSCITSHSRYGTPGAPDSGGGGGENGPAPPRLTGMFPYVATEKDCVDSAECTICLEEFEVGVPMARLECLCRFHKACIAAWFVDHPGRCPVHQHDSFGF